MEGSRGFYLTGWSGKDGHTQDRILRGTNLRVPHVCLSLLGGIQPARVAPLLKESIATGGGDGFLARFSLTVWPDSPGEYRAIDRVPDEDARKAAHGVYERLHSLVPADIGAELVDGVAPFLRLEAAAAEAFTAWDVELRNRLRSGGDDRAHLPLIWASIPRLSVGSHYSLTLPMVEPATFRRLPSCAPWRGRSFWNLTLAGSMRAWDRPTSRPRARCSVASDAGTCHHRSRCAKFIGADGDTCPMLKPRGQPPMCSKPITTSAGSHSRQAHRAAVRRSSTTSILRFWLRAYSHEIPRPAQSRWRREKSFCQGSGTAKTDKTSEMPMPELTKPTKLGSVSSAGTGPASK